MSGLRFTKMHGLGNDYVYIDAHREQIDDPAALARRVSDRHFGIGSDGLILVGPPSPGTDAHVRMRMFNADGSEAEMCGNGVRCVCKFAYDRDLTRADPMRIETGAGVLVVRYSTDARGRVERVTVGMGSPRFEPRSLPVVPAEPAAITQVDGADCIVDAPVAMLLADAPATLDGLTVTCVSMGNPHAVIFVDRVADVPLDVVGPYLETHAVFPRRVNTHFVERIAANEVRMRTWERGSGATLACGTGAAAVCVAGALTGRTDRVILAHLPGGDLELAWRKDGEVEMTGPAVEVYVGEWGRGTEAHRH